MEEEKKENDVVKLWYSYSVQERLCICKLMNDFLVSIPYPIEERQGMRPFKKQDMFDYIMKEGRGHFNPKIVENSIDFFFSGEYV